MTLPAVHVTGISRSSAMALAVLVIGCADGPADPGPPRDAVLLAAHDVVSIQETWTGYGTATRSVITTPAAWASAWATLYENVVPKPALPVIDFGSDVVVLAAMGTRSTGGYSVTIEEVRAHKGVLHVAVLERSPGPTCGTHQAITAPVHVVQVPREGTTAAFAVTTETDSC